MQLVSEGVLTELGAVLADKYRVLAKLGEGGMGSVFRAENLLTGKQVALKCMHPHATANADSSERLLREARAASSLSHPNVVDVYDIVRDGQTLFLVMELLEGQTLRDYLNDNPRPKIPEFLSLMLHAMAGVAAAHARGVIHRDLKPDNIFLARVADLPNPVVKVLDFGIAKLAVARGPTLTQTGVSLGTPFYMSLEQLRGDKDVDQRTDVYAFGVMLYEAVTGSLPYDAETLPELAIKAATTDPAPVKSLRPEVPTPLARLIDEAVARDRNKRSASVRLLQQELETFAREHSFRAQMTWHDSTMPRLAAVSADQPQQLPAASVASSGPRTDPDTFDVRERHASARPVRTRARWTVGAALMGLLSAGYWLIGDRAPAAIPPAIETTIAPAASQALVETAPLAAPNPLPAPGGLLEPAADTKPQPADELPQETPKLTPELAPPAKPSQAAPALVAHPAPPAQPAQPAEKNPPVLLTLPAQPPSTVKQAPVAPVPAPIKKKTPLDLVGF